MANPVVRGFQRIRLFSGRDTRRQFWPYAGVVFALVFVVSGMAMAWVMSSIFADMQQFAVEHPEAATVRSSPGSYSISVDARHPEAPMPDLGPFNATMAGSILMAVGLLAAAISRRLHDSGRSALWGIMPLPFLLFGLAGLPLVMAEMGATEEPNLGLFFLLFFNNVVYMVALVSLIVLLASAGTNGPNKYGSQPPPG